MDNIYNTLRREGHLQFMTLKIHVTNPNPEFKELYQQHIDKYIQKLLDNPKYIDAGFDLLVSNDEGFTSDDRFCKLDLDIICEAELINIERVTMYEVNTNKNANYTYSHKTGFYIYPRSSIYKTPLRLANSVGIIDAGYRGHIIAMFDKNINESLVTVKRGERLVQICAPSLMPIVPILVDEYDINFGTGRGTGGFGSTGK
jgi:dUTP pyrophosphatase